MLQIPYGMTVIVIFCFKKIFLKLMQKVLHPLCLKVRGGNSFAIFFYFIK